MINFSASAIRVFPHYTILSYIHSSTRRHRSQPRPVHTLFPVVAPGPEPVGPLVPVHSSVVPTAVAPHSRDLKQNNIIRTTPSRARSLIFVFRLSFIITLYPRILFLLVFSPSPRSTVCARTMIHAPRALLSSQSLSAADEDPSPI